MRTRKRLFAYVIDLVITTVIGIILSVIPVIITGMIALLFLPFVVSYEDTWNPILSVILNFSMFIGLVAFFGTSIGVNFEFSQTWGYKINGLVLEKNHKLRLFTRWFIRNGLLGTFIFTSAFFIANDLDYKSLYIPFFIYGLYLLIDGIKFVLTKGNKTLTDIWTGNTVLDVPDKKQNL